MIKKEEEGLSEFRMELGNLCFSVIAPSEGVAKAAAERFRDIATGGLEVNFVDQNENPRKGVIREVCAYAPLDSADNSEVTVSDVNESTYDDGDNYPEVRSGYIKYIVSDVERNTSGPYSNLAIATINAIRKMRAFRTIETLWVEPVDDNDTDYRLILTRAAPYHINVRVEYTMREIRVKAFVFDRIRAAPRPQGNSRETTDG